MSSSLSTVGIAAANVACSVSLVLVNKAVFSSGFNFPMTLTCLHFVFTVLFYRILASCAFFEMRAIPQMEAFKIAGFGVGSIGFMNISLHLNSVGFYQITKLAIVPCTLAAQVAALCTIVTIAALVPPLAWLIPRTALLTEKGVQHGPYTLTHYPMSPANRPCSTIRMPHGASSYPCSSYCWDWQWRPCPTCS
eukprot:scaffold105137_cov37-Tisochrysis_lutea.AAC.1